MAQNFVQKSKPPRKLGSETLESFEHWQSQFRSCYKRDPNYAAFFDSDVKWDSSKESWGLRADKIGDSAKDRSAANKKESYYTYLTNFFDISDEYFMFWYFFKF